MGVLAAAPRLRLAFSAYKIREITTWLALKQGEQYILKEDNDKNNQVDYMGRGS